MANRKPFLVRSICLGLMILGMHGCFYHCFLPYTNFIKFMVMLMVAAVWFTALCTHPFQRLERRVARRLHSRKVKYPAALAGWLLTVAAAVVYCVVDYQHLYLDGVVISKAIVSMNDLYFNIVSERFFPRGFGEANGSHLLFLVECVLIFYMAKVTLRRRGLFWGILPACVLISGCLMVGVTPEPVDMILMLCGALGLKMLHGETAKGGDEGFRQLNTGAGGSNLWNPAILLLLVLLLTGIGGLSLRTADFCLRGEKDLLQRQHRMEREMMDAGARLLQRIQTLLGVEQPGVMTDVGPHYKDEKVMTIHMDERPTSDLYLRGFIGTHYEDGKWDNDSDELLSKYFTDDDCYGFYCLDYGNIQTALREKKENIMGTLEEWDDTSAGAMEKNMDTEGAGMTISFAKDNRTTYSCFPYDSCLDEESMGVLRLDHDRGFRRDQSVRSFQVKNLSTSRDRVDVSLMQDWLLQEGHVPYYSANLDFAGFYEPKGKKIETPYDAVVYPSDRSNSRGDEEGLQEPFSIAAGELVPRLSRSQYLWVNNKTLARYYQFVLQEYTKLPEEGLDQTKQLARDLVDTGAVKAGLQGEKQFYTVAGQESAADLIQSLRSYLGFTTKYSRNLQMKLSPMDFVENFLFEEKKGFCQHYATAGAVLFRAMGIPSRYVSGYYVPVKKFRKLEDGSYEADVLDSDAHAWSEVMAINGGWTVADLTPNGTAGTGTGQADGNGQGQGSGPFVPTPTPVDTGDDAFLKNREGKEEEETLPPEQSQEPESDGEETEEPEQANKKDKEKKNQQKDSTQAPENDSESGQENREDAGVRKALPYLISGAVVLLVLVILHHNQRAARRRKLKRCRSYREKILMMNRLMEQFLNTCGYHSVKQMTDEEYIAFLNQIYPRGQAEKLAEEYYDLLEQARFAQGDGETEQVRRCRRILHRFGRAALAGKGRMRRFYVRYVRNWR